MLGREVVKGQENFSILRQTLDGLRVFCLVGFQEQVERLVRMFSGVGHPDLMQFLFRLGLQTLGHFIKDVGRLVDPAALLAGLRIDLLDGFPKAQRPVADRQLRVDLPLVAFTSKSSPFHDCSLSRKPSTTAINSFFPSAVAPISTRMHCRSSSRRMLKCTPSAHTYTYCLPFKDCLFHSWNSASQTLFERVTVVADRPGQSGPTRAFRASLKSPVLIAFQVQPRNQFLDALGLSQVRRQNLRGERFGLACRPAIPYSRLLHLDGSHAGRNLPLGQESIADHLAWSLLVLQARPCASTNRPPPAGSSASASSGLPLEESPSLRPELGDWQTRWFRDTLSHGGVLLGIRWL